MAEKQTSRSVIKITEEAVKKLLSGVVTTQKGILRRVNGLIRNLDIRNDLILPNQNNIRELRKIRADLPNLVVNPAYQSRVETYLNNFNKIKSENDKFYLSTLPGFNPGKQVYKEVLNSSISLTRNSLTESGINQFVINPMIEILNNGITTGADVFEMEETLRTLVVGDSTRLGGLERYVTQISRDALNQFSSNYTQSISANTGMQWYFYSGTIIDDSRSYCIQRAGKYFHKKEVENVPQQWDGRIPGTNAGNIYTNRGGYNCRHLYMPVLIDVVPKDVIDRNIANGNYQA